jgi:hypothetical protein
LKVLEEVDRQPGQSGAIVRREGLYSSHLSAWRKQRDDGALEALGKKRGPKGKSAEQLQLEKLQRDKARLDRELGEVVGVLHSERFVPRRSQLSPRSVRSLSEKRFRIDGLRTRRVSPAAQARRRDARRAWVGDGQRLSG